MALWMNDTGDMPDLIVNDSDEIPFLSEFLSVLLTCLSLLWLAAG